MANKIQSKSSEPVFYATGGRKTSKARVFLKKGNGQVTINKKTPDVYFKNAVHFNILNRPFIITNTKKDWNAYVTVKGGGICSQLEAVRHGLSRALSLADKELYKDLKKAGLLTRDPRMVERKKYGQHKARKSTQYSKR